MRARRRGMPSAKQRKDPPPPGASNDSTLSAASGAPRRISWRRWFAWSLLSGLIVDASLVGTDRSLNFGLTISDYASVAQIGTALYVALALVVLARLIWRLG